MLPFRDVEIGGNKWKKVPGTVLKQGVDFQTNCRSEKTGQIDLLSYSLSWISPSLRLDMMFH